MKKELLIPLLLLMIPIVMTGQTEADLTSRCVLNAGPNTTYLKDHVIKLPKAVSGREMPVVKENIYLMKGTKYRFTLCNSDDSKGELIVGIYEKDRKIISSYDEKGGKTYGSIDFICNKTGMYTLWYSFREGEQGMGIGVVSLLR